MPIETETNSSIIMKDVTLPDNWVHLQKTMTPCSLTDHYYSVWYDPPVKDINGDPWFDGRKGTAWLMCCSFEDDPSVNDAWRHVEDLHEEHKQVLNVIESVYKVSFHESIWQPMTATEVVKNNPLV